MDVFKLTLVRHGETPENKLQIIQGHRDTILSRKGEKQAQLLAQRLETETFTHVFCSDLTRAQQTCEIIMKQNKKSKVQIKTDVRLRERKLGVLEGQPMSSGKGLLRSDSKKQNSSGMETKQQLRQHAKSFFKELCACMQQFRQHISRQQCLTGEYGASPSDSPKDACSLSFIATVHKLPSPGASAETFQETSELNLEGRRNEVELTERSSLELGDFFGNNNSTSNNVEELPVSKTRNCNDSRLPPDVPTYISKDGQDVLNVSDTVGDADDYQGICNISDKVNEADNYHGTCNVSVRVDDADNSDNNCRISGNKLAESGESTSILTTDDERTLGKVCTVSSSKLTTECFESDSQTHNVFASVLVVSHGGLLMELLAYFVKELKCKIPEAQRATFHVIPNAGVSRFIVQVSDGAKALPKVVCLSVFETDHLSAGNEDTAALVSLADLI